MLAPGYRRALCSRWHIYWFIVHLKIRQKIQAPELHFCSSISFLNFSSLYLSHNNITKLEVNFFHKTVLVAFQNPLLLKITFPNNDGSARFLAMQYFVLNLLYTQLFSTQLFGARKYSLRNINILLITAHNEF